MNFQPLTRFSKAIVSTLFVVALLTACGTSPKDDTAKMSVEELYADAKDDLKSGNYERATKSFERLEGRAAGTVIAEQAQLELAYIYYKTNDRVQALATLERSSSCIRPAPHSTTRST